MAFPGPRGQDSSGKVNHRGFLTRQDIVGGSDTSWTICKSFAPRCSNLITQFVQDARIS